MSSAKSIPRPWENLPTVPARPVQPQLRRSPIPIHEPHAASRVAWDLGAGPSPTQGTLALALPQDVAPNQQSPTSSRMPPPSEQVAVGLLPEPRDWAMTFIQAAMEVAGGLRSAGQLVRWTTPEVHAILLRRGALVSRARRPGSTTIAKPRLRALLTCTPRPGICEASAVVAEPDRIRAVAFRMEGLHGRWRVTDLEIG
jgi:hypothetical protein